MAKAGSVGSGQAIFYHLRDQGGDFAAESSSAWPRERPLSHAAVQPLPDSFFFLAVPNTQFLEEIE